MNKPILSALLQDGFRRSPWKNGGGVTVDITGAYRPDAEGDSWAATIWRFGRTVIATPAPFSDLRGYERMQLVIEGAGLVLETPEGEIDLRQALKPVRYDGGLAIVSRLEQGPVEVVNLMADRSLCEIDFVVMEPERAVQLTAGTHVVYAPRESVSGVCDNISVSVLAGDALKIEAKASATLRVDAGLALLASIQERTPQA